MKKQTLIKLRVSRKEAKNKIQMQIEKGELLRDQDIWPEDELDQAYREAENWSKYNTALLMQLFDNLSLSDDYKSIHYSGSRDLDYGTSDLLYLINKRRKYEKDMADSINSLKGLCDRLELFDEVLDNTPHTLDNKGGADNPIRTFGDHVFIVHGHDEGSSAIFS